MGGPVFPRGGGAGVWGARVTAICTVVVRPTNTGSVPRGPGVSAPTPSRFSAWYQGPQVPSSWRARTRAEVPRRSGEVSATIENGLSWWISRMLSPTASLSSGCCVSFGAVSAGSCCSPESDPEMAHGTIMTVAASAVKRIDGAERRDCTD